MEQRDYKQAVDSIIVKDDLQSRIHDELFKSPKKKRNITKFVLKHKKLSAAAIILIVLSIPVSVIGARGIWQQHLNVSVENIGEYAMSYTFETASNVPQDSDVVSLIHAPVKIAYGYVPEGYVNTGNNKLSLNGKGEGGFSIIVYSVDADNPLNFQGVSKITDTEINGRKAIIQERLIAWNSLLIFYDEYGYAIQIFYKGVSDDDLIRFGNGLDLVQCASGEGVDITAAKYSVPQPVVTQAPVVTDGVGFAAIGDEIKGFTTNPYMSKDLSFTVENVKILDSINGLEKSGFTYYDNIKKNFGEDGSILSKSVQNIKRGDGINSVDTIVGTTTYNQKLVYVTVKCVNNSNNVLNNMIIKPQIILTNSENGNYSTRSVSYPEYCDKAYTPYAPRLDDYNYFTIQPNEEFEFHLAYLLTEEDLNRTLLVHFSTWGGTLTKVVRIAN